MRKPINLQELIEFAFPLYAGIVSYTPMTMRGKPVELVNHSSNVALKYSVKNDIWAFVHDGKEYVVPYFSGIRRILEECGFTEKSFPVPFSNNDFPTNDVQKWNNIVKTVHKWNIDSARSKCKTLAENHNITPLPEELLESATEIPFEGILVQGKNGHCYMEYPNLHSDFTTAEVLSNIGTYDIDNELIVINSIDGRTYVVEKSDALEAELQRNGYREKPLRVPFANGEVVFKRK